jgi:hypothetical protein
VQPLGFGQGRDSFATNGCPVRFQHVKQPVSGVKEGFSWKAPTL